MSDSHRAWSAATDPALDLLEKPRNGIAGLRYLRYDILSGIVVSLVSLPLSSGIAIASGAPPVYGLISAIIAGLVFPFVGGSYVTIAGPAAGLAPALLAIMVSFGGAGDADHVGEGYHFLLVVICLVGILQIFISWLKLARFAAIFPASVVEGMLAAIGLLIIAKSLPMFFGYLGPVHAHDFYEFIHDVPEYIHDGSVAVAAVSGGCLALMFVLASSAARRIKLFGIVPPQLLAVVAGVILGQVFGLGALDARFLIQLPENPFHGLHSPAFGEMLARTDLWYAAAIGVITLTLIDGVESLATAIAVDRIDPFRRKSEPNRLLLAMGVANICSSMVGGLTIIPGGVKSKVNINAGGRTLWANFTNAICLIVYLLLARELIGMIPKGVLGAVLIYTGWKMCEPAIWRHVASVGRQQIMLYAFTVVVTLMTDLLWGIIAGTLAKLAYNVWCLREVIHFRDWSGRKDLSMWECTKGLFQNPVGQRETVDGMYRLHLDKPLVCFNAFHLGKELQDVPAGTHGIQIFVGPKVAVIDHTACDRLLSLVDEFAHSEAPVKIYGLQQMRRLSKDEKAVMLHLGPLGLDGDDEEGEAPHSAADSSVAEFANQ